MSSEYKECITCGTKHKDLSASRCMICGSHAFYRKSQVSQNVNIFDDILTSSSIILSDISSSIGSVTSNVSSSFSSCSISDIFGGGGAGDLFD